MIEPSTESSTEAPDVAPQLGAFAAFLQTPWRVQAACRGGAPRGKATDTERHPWFPDWGETHSTAKEVCQRCPVRIECLNTALEFDESYGIWGGLSKRERDYCKLLTERGVPVIVAMSIAEDYRNIKRESGIDPIEELLGGEADLPVVEFEDE